MADSSGKEASTTINVGILTVSDSCHAGKAEDKSGPTLQKLVKEGNVVPNGFVSKTGIVPDEEADIKAKLLDWCDNDKLDLIITTGGTGFAPRDVTPEATRCILHKEAPGLTLAILKGSLDVTPLAMLSRPVCGVRGKSLIINLPGSRKAVQECVGFLRPALGHAVDLLRGRSKDVASTHAQLQGEAPKSVPVSQPPVEHHGHSCTSVQHEEIHPGFHHRTSLHSEVDVSKVARRHRLSPFPLVTVEEAVQKVLEHAHVCSIETVSYSDALGRVLAEDVFAKDPLPPFRASIKDGYAVISSDGAGLRKVLGDCAAGAMPKSEVIPGYCIRINTGAPIPAGADAVIQVEDTELVKDADAGRSELEINLISTPKPGQDIRPLGCDIEKGQLVLQKNLRLGPSELGLLATVGVTSVKCYRVPNVGVLSTGNELLDPSKPLKPGHIRDSNRTTLLALLREQGYVPLDLGIAEDSTMSLLEQMTSALEKCDVLITSGGVSMGDKDLIKEVIQVDLKAKIHFGRVFMKPGKPTTFATAEYEGAKKLLFCLPGNPVSATVTSNLYVLPALRKMSGNISPKTPLIKAKLGFDLKLDSRPEYHRAVLTWDPQEDLPVAQSTGNQLSSRLLSMRAANAMLLLPARSEDIPSVSAGFVVSAMMIGPM